MANLQRQRSSKFFYWSTKRTCIFMISYYGNAIKTRFHNAQSQKLLILIQLNFMPKKVTYFKSFYYVHWTIEKLSLKSSSYREANVVRKCLHFRIISLCWPKSLYSGRGFPSTDLIYAKIFQPNRLSTHFFLRG